MGGYTVIIIIEDDDAYLQWVDQHPEGYIVNAQRRPTPDYLKLHRATCSFISSEARENWTTKQYIKICSLDLDQLTTWAKREVGGELKSTCYCCKDTAPAAQESAVRRSEVSSIADVKNKWWNLWRQCEELTRVENLTPLKTSWVGSLPAMQWDRFLASTNGRTNSIQGMIASQDCHFN